MNSNYVRGASLSCLALQVQIQQMLTGSGACDFRVDSEDGKAAIDFSSGEHRFRLVLPPPATSDPPSDGGHDQQHLDATRHAWRQPSLLVQAKAEAVGAGIVSFDEEFLAYMLLPGGRTVFQAAVPAIASSYAAARRPSLQDGAASASARTGTGAASGLPSQAGPR